MMPFRKIVYAVDFSQPCRAAAPYVKDMVRHESAELVVFHAFDVAPLMVEEAARLRSGNFLAYPELRRNEEAKLRGFAQELFHDVHHEFQMEDGEPGVTIARAIRRNGADLLMMPTHGHGPVRRFLLGSVTAKILHDADCPLWTVIDHGGEPRLPCRSVLCALDFDGDAGAVAKAAGVLARSRGASLCLAHSVEPPPAMWEADYAAFRDEQMARARRKLEALRVETGMESAVDVVGAHAGEGVRGLAIKHGADLIVIGRGRMQAAFGQYWSRIYSIVRDAPCPVLSI